MCLVTTLWQHLDLSFITRCFGAVGFLDVGVDRLVMRIFYLYTIILDGTLNMAALIFMLFLAINPFNSKSVEIFSFYFSLTIYTSSWRTRVILLRLPK